MDLEFVYKICSKYEWSSAKKKGQFKGSEMDLKDGFIHFSERNQVQGTLNKFFINKKNLLLLKVKTIGLKSLIWEQGSDGNMFPHLYSKLDISDVVDEIDITLKNDGTHELPDNY